MSRSANLFRLQNIDTQIQHINNRIREIENILNDNRKLIEAEKQVNVALEKLSEIEKKVRLADRKVRDQQSKIEVTDKALYGGKVRNPKELQDLHNEAAALRRYLEVLEDRQLEAMISFEEAEIKHQTAEERLESTKASIEVEHNELKGELSNLTDDISRLKVERNAVIRTIDKEDLNLYEKLLTSRRGLAVVKISDHTCGACGATLSPAIIQSAQSPIQIVQCHSCRRIIYPG